MEEKAKEESKGKARILEILLLEQGDPSLYLVFISCCRSSIMLRGSKVLIMTILDLVVMVLNESDNIYKKNFVSSTSGGSRIGSRPSNV